MTQLESVARGVDARVKATRSFVIYAGTLNENVGGSIALHRLCDLLNRNGAKALLWPEKRPVFDPSNRIHSARQLFRHYRRAKNTMFSTGLGFMAPIARPRDLPGSIVIYPEVVDGNPLRAQQVIRWLLHKPGFHTNKVSYGRADRFFYYQKVFDDPALNPDQGNLLKVTLIRDDIYRQTNFGERRGTCYFLRKGKGRRIVHDLADSVLVDGWSHADLVNVFNRVKTCISYDMHTMYSSYAALCGCVSVVVPEEGMTKEQWYPDPRDRYGVAYGFEDIKHAVETQHLVLPHLKLQEAQDNDSVQSFMAKCATYFPCD